MVVFNVLTKLLYFIYTARLLNKLSLNARIGELKLRKFLLPGLSAYELMDLRNTCKVCLESSNRLNSLWIIIDIPLLRDVTQL